MDGAVSGEGTHFVYRALVEDAAELHGESEELEAIPIQARIGHFS